MGDTAPVLPIYDLNGKKIARIFEFDRKHGRPTSRTRMENHGEQLKETLENLGIETEHRMNLDEDGIKEELKKVAKSKDELALFWVFIFSNFDSEYIPCQKGAVGLNDLWGPFTGDKCKALFGKPKLFFIQADIVERDRQFMPLMNITSFEEKRDKIIQTLPVSSDIMLAHFRRHKRDKNFSIARFISEELSNSKPRSMNQIMTSILGRRWTNAPKFSSTFCKQLYLPPGSACQSSDFAPGSAVHASLKHYNISGKRMAYSFVFKHFKGLYDLPGADGDKRAIERAMAARGFTYEDCNKEWTMTAQSVIEKLREIAENKENAECVMIFVSTHGTSNHKLYAHDGTFNMSDLWTVFTENDGYKGKPKIFFVDACRGVYGEKSETKMFIGKGDGKSNSSDPTGIEPVNHGGRTTSDDSQQKRRRESHGDESDRDISTLQEEGEEKEEEFQVEMPNFSDIFVGLSTIDGKLALQERDHPGGSMYMTDLCQKLTNLRGTCSIFDILVSAHCNVSKTLGELVKQGTCNETAKEEIKPEYVTQMPTFTSSLREDFCMS